MTGNRPFQAAATAVLLLMTSAFPWVKVGHRTICAVALMNMDPATLEKLKPLLGDETLVDIATWADEVKRGKRDTRAWHFINIPIRENIGERDLHRFFGMSRDSEDNIVSQVKKDIAELKNAGAPPRERGEALRFLVHFIGDAHQPLHCADDNDKRGNEKEVIFFPPDSRKGGGHPDNLHSLWNNLIEMKAAEDPEELAKRINGRWDALQKRKWASGTIESWVVESYAVARDRIYPGFAPGPASAHPLPKTYYDDMRPIVEEQLEKAGLRLAKTLEDIFGK
jgi:hypothetical protein